MEDLKNNTNVNEIDEKNDSEDEYVKVNTDATAAEIAAEYRSKLFPFTTKKYIYGAVGFILAAVFFALPGIISLISYILPTNQFLNYIATQTQSFMHTDVLAMYLALVWLLLGYSIDCIAEKKPFFRFPYSSFREFVSKNKVRIIFGILLVIMTVSSLLSNNMKGAFENQTDGMFIWYNVALAAFCVSLIKDKKQIRALIVIFAVSALLTATVMFRQYVMYYMHVSFDNLWTTDFSAIKTNLIDLRQVRGIFANSNHCGYYLTMGTLAAAGLLVTSDKLWKKIVWGVVLALLVNAVILNDTLGSVLATFLVILLIPLAFCKSSIRWYMRVLPILIMTIVIVFVSAFPQLPMGSNTLRNSALEIIDTFKAFSKDDNQSEQNATSDAESAPAVKSEHTSASEAENSGNDEKSAKNSADLSEASSSKSSDVIRKSEMSSVAEEIISLSPTPEIKNTNTQNDDRWWLKNQSVGTDRLGLWQYAIELMSRKPLLGYGANGAHALFEKNISGLNNPAARVHNEYLQIGLDFGIPAMLLHLTAYILVVVYFFAAMRKRELSSVQRIMFLMFAAYAFSALTGICAYYTASYFYILLALLVSTFEGSVHEYKTEEADIIPGELCCESACLDESKDDENIATEVSNNEQSDCEHDNKSDSDKELCDNSENNA